MVPDPPGLVPDLPGLVPAPPHTEPRLAASTATLRDVDALVAGCFACPRLVAWREDVAAVRRLSFRHERYWGRGVPSFGDEAAHTLLVGLAPAAHGGNRTGRMFTGDPSGDFLFAALHRAGYANQPTSVSADDGLVLSGMRICAPVHCAPPDNKPTPDERRRCAPYLARELELLAPTLRCAVVLGAFGWQALLATLTDSGWLVPRPRPRFAHSAEVDVVGPDGRALTLLGTYHVSARNTYTRLLTPDMLDAVLVRARQVAAG